MKKAAKIIGFLLWLGGGIALVVLGMVFTNNVVLFTGVGVLFGGAFLSAVGMLIVAALRARKRVDQPTETRAEKQKREETQGRRRTQLDEAEDAFVATAKNWRLADKGDKIKGTLFLVTFLTCCALFVVFLSIGKTTWGLIAWGCGMGMMVIALIVVTIKDKLSARKERKAKGEAADYTDCKGMVLACELVHGEAGSEHEGQALYRITLQAEGRMVSCLCSRAYQEGELLNVMLNKHTNRCIIKEK